MDNLLVKLNFSVIMFPNLFLFLTSGSKNILDYENMVSQTEYPCISIFTAVRD